MDLGGPRASNWWPVGRVQAASSWRRSAQEGLGGPGAWLGAGGAGGR